MLPTIAELRRALVLPGSHERLVADLLARARAPAAEAVFTALFDDQALAAARAADALLAAGRPPATLPPLAGLPVTVKGLFDVAGQVTLAGSKLRRGEPPAAADAGVVARLRAAGAALIGHTNMTEFAFSGIGLNPHHGTPVNPAALAVDPAVPRIPGGSSSGAAVSVALGLAVAGLGSDTGGSIRIPAALCGLVGFKNTQSRTPLDGAFPLSWTLDTACAMARSVDDCLLVDAVLSGQALAVPPRTPHSLRLALPQALLFDDLEPAVARAFERALAVLADAGVQLVPVALRELDEIAGLNAPAGLSAIEAFAVHRDALRDHGEAFDPRVAARVRLGEGISVADHFHILQRRRDWIARTAVQLAGFDAWVCPTVPMTAPPIAELDADDERFFAANRRMLRNTFAVNFLDGCAFSLPCHAPGELPVGLMLAAPGGHDAALAGVARAVEALLAPLRAAA